MARGLQNYPNIDGPDSDYPDGRIKDNDGSGNGTPINEFTNGDLQQFFAKMMREANISPNGLPDSEYIGFQYFEAFIDLLNSEIGRHFVLSQIGNYTADDLIVLYGCMVSANIPGTSAITAGAIYYNGNIYRVDADAAIITTGSQTLVFKIENIDRKLITLIGAASGSGIANYNAITVKHLNFRTNGNTALTAFSSSNGSFNSGTYNAIRKGDIVNIAMRVVYTVTTGASQSGIILNVLENIDILESSITSGSITGVFLFYNQTAFSFMLQDVFTNGLNPTDVFIDANGRININLDASQVSNGDQVKVIINMTAKCYV